MPAYESKVAGQDKPRLVKAETATQARNHVVTASAGEKAAPADDKAAAK